MPQPWTITYSPIRRRVNLVKLNARTGRVIWSRYFRPPMWPLMQDEYRTDTYDRCGQERTFLGGNGPATRPSSNCLQVEPIHGTNDVAVYVNRPFASSPAAGMCRDIVARISGNGCADCPRWMRHIHYATSLVSLAAFANGRTCAATTKAGDPLITLDIWDAAGSLVDGAQDFLHASGNVFEIPGANEAVLFGPTTSGAQLLQRRAGAITWARGYVPYDDELAVLSVSSLGILCAEIWMQEIGPSWPGQPGRKEGLVLRDVGGVTGYGPLAPPQPDILADNMRFADAHTPPYTFWRAYSAATYAPDNAHYVRADFCAADPGSISPPILTRDRLLVRFDSAFNVVWQIPYTTNLWGILADEHGILVGSIDPDFQIERRDTSGALIWRQRFGRPGIAGSEMADMCFGDDGSLYVCSGEFTL
jgi:hypothetical protein